MHKSVNFVFSALNALLDPLDCEQQDGHIERQFTAIAVKHELHLDWAARPIFKDSGKRHQELIKKSEVNSNAGRIYP